MLQVLLLACSFIASVQFDVPAIRNVKHSSVSVIDVESRIPANRVWRSGDIITWVHEDTHEINNMLRNRYGHPCFYLLGGTAVSCKELNCTLAQIARNTPRSLRGSCFSLYLIDAQRWWNRNPSYILDELSAYINGSECRRKAKIGSHAETEQFMHEFAAYSLVMLYSADCRDVETIACVKALIARAQKIGGVNVARAPPMVAIRQSADCSRLRTYLNGIGIQ